MRLIGKHKISSILLSLLSAIFVVLLYFQTEYTARINGYYKEVKQLYAKSEDGKVYLDMDNTSPLGFLAGYASGLPQYGAVAPSWRETGLGYEDYCFRSHMHDILPGKPDIVIVPKLLEGKDNEPMQNQIAEVSPGCFLVIQDQRNPKTLYVERSINLPGLHRQYEPMEIDMDEYLLCQGEQWKARLVFEEDYSVLGLSDEKFVLR